MALLWAATMIGWIHTLWFVCPRAYDDGENSVRNEAVARGFARWEVESQENPEVVFKWNDEEPTP